MIYNENKVYARVWKVTPGDSGKYIDLQITTSEKEGDEWKNSSWFPRVIGKAVNTLKEVKVGDSIKITKSKFTNERGTTESGGIRSYFKFLIFEAEIMPPRNGELSKTTKNQPADVKNSIEETDDSCPW